ncbi:MAG TPA: phosphopantothenoylcysteine decarboxylase [Chthoniobacterales bacterium]|nr:phosphopantothenoylcysteine decarboxylase [Chthoniobacterales bacterium]
MRFVVTAGPTREPIDPVRYISNRSSGKMGYAIVEAAITTGHDVTLISGPVHFDQPHGAHVVSVMTSDEMFYAVHQHLRDCDILVMCAAVADYKPAIVAPRKIKKRDASLTLELVPTRDILTSIPHDREFLVIGFAAETDELEKKAAQKLRAKNCDIIVANDVSRADAGIESDENAVTLLFRGGKTKKISRAPKKIIARELVEIFLNAREKRLTTKT